MAVSCNWRMDWQLIIVLSMDSRLSPCVTVDYPCLVIQQLVWRGCLCLCSKLMATSLYLKPSNYKWQLQLSVISWHGLNYTSQQCNWSHHLSDLTDHNLIHYHLTYVYRGHYVGCTLCYVHLVVPVLVWCKEDHSMRVIAGCGVTSMETDRH